MAPIRSGLRIGVLGPLEILVDGTPLATDTRKASAILALLAVEGRTYARDELAALFWPDSDDEAARGSLRRTLSALRAGLGNRWITIDRAIVALTWEGVSADLHDVARLAGEGSEASLAAAAALIRGPFLAGFALRDSPGFDDWRAVRASAAEMLGAQVLVALIAAREDSGDLGGALQAARRLVELDPLDEAAHRRVITLLAATGDRGGAIRQYRALVAILERELGVAPLSETTALYEEIREAGGGGPGPSSSRRGGAASSRERRRATSIPGDSGSGAPAQLPFVGRDAELARLLALHGAVRSAGRVVGIAGEPGIGKTRLAREAARAVRSLGGVALETRAYAAEAGVAYAPLTGLLRQQMRAELGVTRLAGLSPSALAVLGRIVELPAGLARRAMDGTPPADPMLARSVLIDALASAVSRLLEGPRPGILAVDDIQWADPSTLEFLGYLARRMEDRPYLLVLTWRPADLSGDVSNLVGLLAEPPISSVIQLPRLAPDAVAQLVSLAIQPSTGSISPAMLNALVEASEGLPLYLSERLAEPPPGHPERSSTGPTQGFRALLRERLGSVTEMAGQVLAAGAVIGRSFDLATLRAAGGRTEDETVAALEELLARGLLRESEPGGELRFDFAHGSLRDAAYEATSLVRRRILHRRVADALRASGERRPGGGTLERMALIARHEEAAGRSVEAAEAYAAAVTAARAVHANREAAELLAAAQALGHIDAGWLQRQLGEVRFAMGEYAEAIAALEGAAAVVGADELGEVELQLGRVHARRGDTAAAVSHLASALATTGDEDGRLRARILVEQSVVALRAGELETARRSAAEALQWAEEQGDVAAAGLVHRVRGLIARAEGNLDEADHELARSLASAGADPDPGARIAAANALALVRAARGDLPGAVDLLELALAEAQRVGMRHLEAAIENNLADSFHRLGDETSSQAHLRRAVELFAAVGGAPGELEPEIWKLEAW